MKELSHSAPWYSCGSPCGIHFSHSFLACFKPAAGQSNAEYLPTTLFNADPTSVRAPEIQHPKPKARKLGLRDLLCDWEKTLHTVEFPSKDRGALISKPPQAIRQKELGSLTEHRSPVQGCLRWRFRDFHARGPQASVVCWLCTSPIDKI